MENWQIKFQDWKSYGKMQFWSDVLEMSWNLFWNTKKFQSQHFHLNLTIGVRDEAATVTIRIPSNTTLVKLGLKFSLFIPN